jgi:hypothetical protein
MVTFRIRERAGLLLWRTLLGLVCLCALANTAGCRRSSGQADTAPGDVLVRLCDLHRQHGYKDMESLVDPARVATTINTLMALDRLLQTGAQLQQTAEQRVGPTAAVVCDISDVADYLGPFSRNVQVVSTRVEGNRALVTFQVGERVPVERAELRRIADRWRYVPDEPDEALPGLLMGLTDRMVRLQSEVEAGPYDEQALIQEYASQVLAPLQAHLAEAARQRQEKARLAATRPS